MPAQHFDNYSSNRWWDGLQHFPNATFVMLYLRSDLLKQTDTVIWGNFGRWGNIGPALNSKFGCKLCAVESSYIVIIGLNDLFTLFYSLPSVILPFSVHWYDCRSLWFTLPSFHPNCVLSKWVTYFISWCSCYCFVLFYW